MLNTPRSYGGGMVTAPHHLASQARRGAAPVRQRCDLLNIMELIAQDMTDDQIRAVSLYFASLRPEEVTPDDDMFIGLDKVEGVKAQRSFVPPEIEFAPANRVQRGEPE